VADLTARRDYLNGKAYSALHLTGPGTDLTVGLPKGHIWESAGMPSRKGIDFIANMPTEEVFTLGDRGRAEGVVKASLPLSYGGTLIEDFSLTFAEGHVVAATAARGETILWSLLDTDEGSARLGEVALVPHSSPIAQSGRLFLNTLIDENAASHLALGSAYRFSIRGAEALSDEAFAAGGGNTSLVHVDFDRLGRSRRGRRNAGGRMNRSCGVGMGLRLLKKSLAAGTGSTVDAESLLCSRVPLLGRDYRLGLNSASKASASLAPHSTSGTSHPKKKRNTGGSDTNLNPLTRPRFL
jgi:hypothetical protein